MVLGIGLAAGVLGPPGIAVAGAEPDLAAFSGCVAAHNAAQAYAVGDVPPPAIVRLVASSIRASKVDGAKKVAKAIRKATRPPRVETAVRRAAEWCTDIGVPPITVPTIAPTSGVTTSPLR